MGSILPEEAEGQGSLIPMIQTSLPEPLSRPELDSIKHEDLVLVPANHLERIHCSYINSSSWRGPLTVEQYLKRENILQNLPAARNDANTWWIMTATRYLTMPAGMARPILGLCETHLRKGMVAIDGQVFTAPVHGIGSVFVRSEYRGRKYANTMLTMLGNTLEIYQQPASQPGLFSVLYSDIGKQFYARLGWKTMISNHISLKPLDADYEALRKSLDLPQVKDIQTSDLERLCTTAAKRLAADLVTASLKQAGQPAVAVEPEAATMSWHHGREEYLCGLLKNGAFPDVKGVQITSDTEAPFLIWTRVYGTSPEENSLYVLLQYAGSYLDEGKNVNLNLTKQMATLLLRAQLEAARWGMHDITLWSALPPTVAGAQLLEAKEKVKIIEREEESICAMRCTGMLRGKGVTWLANEKYPWC